MRIIKFVENRIALLSLLLFTLITFIAFSTSNDKVLFIGIPLIFLLTSMISVRDLLLLFIISIPFYGSWVISGDLSLYNLIAPIVVSFALFELSFSDKERPELRVDRNYLVMLALTVLIILNSFFSIYFFEPRLSIVAGSLVNLLVLSFLYFAIKNFGGFGSKAIRLFVLSITLSGSLSGLNPDYGKFLQYGKIVKLQGLTGNPNILAFFSIIALFLLIEYKPFGNLMNLMLAILNIFFVVFTFSRMGLALLMLLWVFYSLKLIRTNQTKQIACFWAISLLVVLILVFQFGLLDYYSKKPLLPGSFFTSDEGGESNFLDRRLYRWGKINSYWIKNRPFVVLFGLGSGYHSYASKKFHGSKWSVHNSFLEAFMDSGIFALTLYVIWLVMVLEKKSWMLTVVFFLTLILTAGFIRWEFMLTLFFIDALSGVREKWQHQYLS